MGRGRTEEEEREETPATKRASQKKKKKKKDGGEDSLLKLYKLIKGYILVALGLGPIDHGRTRFKLKRRSGKGQEGREGS